MAILWWIATGTHKKMESDVGHKYTGQAFWVPQSIQGEEPLDIDHVLLQLMVLGFGLILSTLLFFGELLFNMYRKHRSGKLSVSFIQVQERKTGIEIVPDPSQSLDNVSEIEIVPDLHVPQSLANISENPRNQAIKVRGKDSKKPTKK